MTITVHSMVIFRPKKPDHYSKTLRRIHELAREVGARTREEPVTNRDGTIIRIGQVWSSLDARDHGRYITITDVDPIEGCVTAVSTNKKMEKTVRVKINRLRKGSSGYRLRKEAPAF